MLKDKHGDITGTDIYRGITLTPVMSKLFELVLLNLFGDFLNSDDLQFGFKEENGCTMLFSHSQNMLNTSLKMAAKCTVPF